LPVNGWKAMRKNRNNSHEVKTKIEREGYIKAVRSSIDERILPDMGDGTLRDDDEYFPDEKGYIGPKRKNKINRIIFHMKEHWPGYLLSVVGVLALFFFVTFNVKIAEIDKDIFYTRERIGENTEKIEKVSDELSSIKSDIQSLNDRFMLFINLFGQSNNPGGVEK
jgi:hypothetical protein